MVNKVRKILAGISVTVLCAATLLTAGCKFQPPGAEVAEGNSEIVSETSEQSSEKEEEKSENSSDDKNDNKDDDKEENKDDKDKNKTEGKTPYEIHGAISVKGTKIVDEHGNDFQLCGVSTHGLGWFPEYVNEASFLSLRDDFGANVVRLAMYTAEGAGYCTTNNKDQLKSVVNDGVKYATDLGMYVIIDWHILHDLDPNVYKDDAKAFFEEMSKKYKDQDNVIYEICNEPNGGTTWSSVKTYAEEIIPIIRANDPNAIIIVGTPTWSQDVDIAANDPITGYDNIMYAVHFYADTHKQDLRNKTKTAIDKGLAVFISEFSICDASGNGNNNINEANTWISFLDEYKISFVAWNLSNKAESSSLISSGCNNKSSWSYNDLSESGKWLIGVLDTHSDQGSRLMDGKEPINGGKDNNNNNNNNGQTGVVMKDATGSLGDMKVTLSATNSWGSGSDVCTQLTITIDNSGSSSVSGWNIEIDLGQDVTVDSAWCCKTSVSGSKIVITPESYNGTISGNTTTSDIGLIVKTKNAINSSSVRVY